MSSNLSNKIFKLSCFDLVDLVHQDVDKIDWPFNLKLDGHKVVNCGKKEEFEQNQFDFVILTLALWGADGSWKDTVFSAFHALKSGGKLLLVEHDNYYGSNFTRILRKSNYFIK